MNVPPDVAAALGISSEAIFSPSPQGMTSEVAFIHDRGRDAVVKRCDDPRYLGWLRQERDVLAALSDSSLPMPRLLGSHDSPNEVWLVMTREPGESLWAVLLRSTPAERAGHFRRLGQLLRRVHGTPAPATLRHERGWLDRMLEQARRNLAWCDGSPDLLERLEATRPAPVPEMLIHGDLGLDNVLVDGDGWMGLIDWSCGGIGDPRSDVALAVSTEPEIVLTDPEIAAFFDGYGTSPLDDATSRWFRDLYEFF